MDVTVDHVFRVSGRGTFVFVRCEKAGLTDGARALLRGRAVVVADVAPRVRMASGRHHHLDVVALRFEDAEDAATFAPGDVVDLALV